MPRDVDWYIEKHGAVCGAISDKQKAINLRNVDIYNCYKKGDSKSELARKHGISNQTVANVISKIERMLKITTNKYQGAKR